MNRAELRRLAEGADRVTFFQRGRKDGHPFVLPENILGLLDRIETLEAALREVLEVSTLFIQQPDRWAAAKRQARAALGEKEK